MKMAIGDRVWVKSTGEFGRVTLVEGRDVWVRLADGEDYKMPARNVTTSPDYWESRNA